MIFFTNLSAKPAAKLWGRLRQLVHFRFSFFLLREKKAPERTRNCEDVSRQTPVFQKTDNLFLFFKKLIAKPAAKLWGRLKPIGHFCFLIIFLKEKTPERTRNCEDVSSQTPVVHQKNSNYFSFLDKFESEIVRTSQAKRPFLKRHDRFYDRVRLQNCEYVSSETSVV